MAKSKTVSIERYTPAHKAMWDEFIVDSRNGTFLLQRDYMEYHADRFADYSLLFFHDSRLIGVLPAHIDGDAFCSHNGLTYGGLIVTAAVKAVTVLDIFSALMQHLSSMHNIKRLIYKPAPHIYHRYPCEDDLYALVRNNAQLTLRKAATVVQQEARLNFSTLRRRKMRLGQSKHFIIHTNANWEEFWQMLEEMLEERHHAQPIHTLQEMQQLYANFSNNIRLYTVTTQEGTLIGGALIFETDRVAHVQYIASTAEGRQKGALDFLFDYLIHVRYRDLPYFDLGTSVEDEGRILNEGLIFQKEGFGGRTIVYDTYQIEINATR